MLSRVLFSALLILITSMLSACGGGGSSNTSSNTIQGVSDGNAMFQVSNNVQQDFAGATVTTNKTGTVLYDDDFFCPVGAECLLAINSNTTEGFTILFYNEDGDNVAALMSDAPPDQFTSVDASAINFGAYLALQLAQLNNGDIQTTIYNLTNYLSGLDRSSALDFLTTLANGNNEFTLPSGSNTSADFLSQVDSAIQLITTDSLSYFNQQTDAINLKPVSFAARPIKAAATIDTPAVCDGPLSPISAVLGKMVGQLESQPLQGLGVLANAVSMILGNGCDVHTKTLNQITKSLSSLQAVANLTLTNTDEIKASIAELQKLYGIQGIFGGYAILTGHINLVSGDIKSYQNLLAQSGATNLNDWFAKNGSNPAAVKLLTDKIQRQKDNFTLLNNAPLYIGLRTDLDTLCNNTALKTATGDMFKTRNFCNGVLTQIVSQIGALETAYITMVTEELNSLYSHNILFSDPYSSDVKTSIEAASNLGKEVLNNLNTFKQVNNSTGPIYDLLDGFDITLSKSMSDPSVQCNVKNSKGEITGPAIIEWWPNTDASFGNLGKYSSYVVTNCLSKTGIYGLTSSAKAYPAKFYYYDPKKPGMPYEKVRNVMGVLLSTTVNIDTSPTWTDAKGLLAYQGEIQGGIPSMRIPATGTEGVSYFFSVPGNNGSTVWANNTQNIYSTSTNPDGAPYSDAANGSANSDGTIFMQNRFLNGCWVRKSIFATSGPPCPSHYMFSQYNPNPIVLYYKGAPFVGSASPYTGKAENYLSYQFSTPIFMASTLVIRDGSLSAGFNTDALNSSIAAANGASNADKGRRYSYLVHFASAYVPLGWTNGDQSQRTDYYQTALFCLTRDCSIDPATGYASFANSQRIDGKKPTLTLTAPTSSSPSFVFNVK